MFTLDYITEICGWRREKIYKFLPFFKRISSIGFLRKVRWPSQNVRLTSLFKMITKLHVIQDIQVILQKIKNRIRSILKHGNWWIILRTRCRRNFWNYISCSLQLFMPMNKYFILHLDMMQYLTCFLRCGFFLMFFR